MPGLRRGGGFGVFATGLALLAVGPARATTVTVPDESPTIQAAINSGATEVLVRPGYYPEAPLIERAMTLRGLLNPGSEEQPVMDGLILDDTYQNSSHSAQLWISSLHFLGPVRYAFHRANFSGPYTLGFNACTLDAGVLNQATVNGQVYWDILECQIAGGLRVYGDGVLVHNNSIQGPVEAGGLYSSRVEANSIEGPGPIGISYGYADHTPVISGNVVRGFDIGIRGDYPRASEVTGNLVEGCTTAGIVLDSDQDSRHLIVGNTVRSCASAMTLDQGELVLLDNVVEDCGSGILATPDHGGIAGNRLSRCGTGLSIHATTVSSEFAPRSITSRQNVVQHCGTGLDLIVNGGYVAERDTVIDCNTGMSLRGASVTLEAALVLSCRGRGLAIEAPSVDVTHCVVGRCTSDGIQVSASANASLWGNTSFLNGGSGFVVRNLQSLTTYATRNIGFGNQLYGLDGDPGTVFSCNDWFANIAGGVSGTEPSEHNFSVDPVFCDVASNNVHLAASSPLLDHPGCGLIGALGLGGCEPVCTPLAARSISLWPPDHEFEVIDLAALGGVLDPDGDPVTLQIVGVTQDEEVFGESPGDGNTSPDAVITAPSVVHLRRERAGGGNGRVYRVAFRATDGHGGECQDTLRVQVPHDQGVQAAEDPLSFESVATQVLGVAIGSNPSGWSLWTRPSPSRGAGTTVEFLITDSRHEGLGVLTVKDVAGRSVRSWSLGQVTKGRHRINWDERARDGTRVNAGVYFVQLQVAGAALTRTHVVLK